MSIYTRRGDRGQTSLADGSRVSKDATRVEALGALDEANSSIGWARAAVADEDLAATLRFAQHRLFNCSAAIASPADPGGRVAAADVAALEAIIDRFQAATGSPTTFVLEGGCEAAARLHVARAVLRRAERRCVTLAATEPIDHDVASFLNRLADLLYAAARYANFLASTPDEPWDPDARPPVAEA